MSVTDYVLGLVIVEAFDERLGSRITAQCYDPSHSATTVRILWGTALWPSPGHRVRDSVKHCAHCEIEGSGKLGTHEPTILGSRDLDQPEA